MREYDNGLQDDPILKAAAQVFADRGFDGARVDEIARLAGVNKAMLYYRIGDKAALYTEVLQRMLKSGVNKIRTEIAQARNAEEKLRRYIGSYAELAGAMRPAAPIMMREMASGGRHLPDEVLKQMEGTVSVLRQILAEGVEHGEFEPVNAFTTHMLIVGSLMFIAVNRPVRERVREFASSEGESEYALSADEAATQVADMLLRSVKKVQVDPG